MRIARYGGVDMDGGGEQIEGGVRQTWILRLGRGDDERVGGRGPIRAV